MISLATLGTINSKAVIYIISALKGDVSQNWKELWAKSANRKNSGRKIICQLEINYGHFASCSKGNKPINKQKNTSKQNKKAAITSVISWKFRKWTLKIYILEVGKLEGK